MVRATCQGNTFPGVLVTSLLTIWVLGTVQASGICQERVCSLAEDVAAVLEVAPSVQDEAQPFETPVGLPPGTLSLEDLERALEALAQDGGTINDFFALLADGQERVLSGEMLRDALEEHSADLSFLPMAQLLRIESDGAELKVLFDFGGKHSMDVALPTGSITVVASTPSQQAVQNFY